MQATNWFISKLSNRELATELKLRGVIAPDSAGRCTLVSMLERTEA